MTQKKSSERLVRDIKRITRRKYSSEEKIRIVIEGMRGEVALHQLEQMEKKWSRNIRSTFFIPNSGRLLNYSFLHCLFNISQIVKH